ncbi:hypothetical protein LWM68_43215 [Niabella sp. W65]|nr:hypothetical protein [Niabella sp. W65]MCH7368949.1 hypothetical protein [Niabella sp. W65]ULT44523.1 hypothetical protein KRR40_14940 [Niabella sp. I65]
MKKIFILLGVLQMLMIAVIAQSNPNSTTRNGFSASLRGGYDGLPFYNNNTPYINYKGGLAAGASFNYYWGWLGLGAILIISGTAHKVIIPLVRMPAMR